MTTASRSLWHLLREVDNRPATLAGVALAVSGLFAIFFHKASFAGAAVQWSAVLVLSFLGWGVIVETWLSPQQRAGWALRAGWGVAFSCMLGSVLLVLHLAFRGVLVGYVAIGYFVAVVVGARSLAADNLARRLIVRGRWYAATAVLGLAALVPAVAALQHRAKWYSSDDAPAYFVFPKEMLVTGGWSQPFSMRAMTSLGGHSFLQALFLAHTVPDQLNAFDMGICLVLAIALVLGLARSDEQRPLALLAAMVVLTTPDLRINTASMMSGVVLLLTAVQTIRHVRFEDGDRRGAILTALPLVAVCSLRQTYILPTVVMVALVCIGELFRSRQSRARLVPIAKSAGWLVVACGVLLVPWLWVQARSAGTPLYPLVSGNFRLGNALNEGYFGARRIDHVWEWVKAGLPMKTWPIFLLGALALHDARGRGATRGLLVGGVIGGAFLVWKYFLDVWAYARYLIAVFLAGAVSVVGTYGAGQRRGSMRGGAWLAAGLVLQLYVNVEPGVEPWRKTFDEAKSVVDEPNKLPERPISELTLRAIQDEVPRGAPIFAAVDEPFLLDFHRNRIVIADFPGFVSPNRPMPFEPNKLSDYLVEQGLRYFYFVLPASSTTLYSRSNWESTMSKFTLSDHALMAPNFVAFADAEMALRESRKILYDDGKIVVLDLATPQ